MLTTVHRDQLFFLAFGRIWAMNMKPAALVQQIRTDPHSPTQFRVDGTLHNVPEFAKAFNCSPKAKVRFSKSPTRDSFLCFLAQPSTGETMPSVVVVIGKGTASCSILFILPSGGN